MKKAICAVGVFMFFNCLFAFVVAEAQNRQPIKWQFLAVATGEHEAKLIFTASLDEGWHIYSQFLEQGGPLPTTFKFIPDKDYLLKGKVKEESAPVKSYDDIFMMEIVWYNNTAVFSQEVKLWAPVTTIRGTIEFMGCTHDMCLPPDEIGFSMEVKASDAVKNNKGK